MMGVFGFACMEILYDDPTLGECLGDDDKCRRVYGEQMRKVIRRRLADIESSDNMGGLRHLPGKSHGPLTGDRAGQFEVHLAEPQRLIFVPVGDPAEYTKSGTIVWERIKAIKVIEIEPNYHD